MLCCQIKNFFCFLFISSELSRMHLFLIAHDATLQNLKICFYVFRPYFVCCSELSRMHLFLVAHNATLQNFKNICAQCYVEISKNFFVFRPYFVCW
ncbi:hypothetical protein PUN28_020931 [Cardiocondyla obscurior]|uniref:Secreted protein n=1 Tax=Cardiocondyla obscurior TaxID=286306 RepID=A0AAW2E5N6_9HYME